ncbi:MAG: class I SAM-dependent methyltransferase [Coriobacteriales bacterium]|jgi:SAM-dependent methyltransferase
MESQLTETCFATRPLPEAPARIETIENYWDGRAGTYSAAVKDEVEKGFAPAWEKLISNEIAYLGTPDTLHALDLGCGPGFLSILLARMGLQVDAMDLSLNMLAQASHNARQAGLAKSIEFHQGDVSDTGLAGGAFDIIISRNVTWLMKDPVAAYREWHRLLAPGGKLLVFDANWYLYLADSVLDKRRRRDQADRSVLGRSQQTSATSEQEDTCEKIAAALPLTYALRPSWDLAILPQLGFFDVYADETVWKRLWSEGEQRFYASSPLFMVSARK